MLNLRPYQIKALNMLVTWFENHNDGHPCLVLPTGAGKSIILAAFCQWAISNWPDTKILMLTHVKELIEQDVEKIHAIWPQADVGVYSASIGRKELGHQITAASIQSIYRHEEILFYDLVLVDEAHLISHQDTGMYRTYLDKLTEKNPALRCIGLTATPYRLGHGYITDGNALFDSLIEPVSIKELQRQGYLARLTSKTTQTQLDVSEVGIRGGEYIEKDLHKAVNIFRTNEAVVEEVINRASDRKSWLFFCSGVDHAKSVCDILNQNGIPSACINGKTSKNERESIIKSYRNGNIKAVTNDSVLTTGFDYPDIDCIVMLRPTLSPGLYLQICGRGMRLKSNGGNCLVLDFAGNVMRHGPVTDVNPPRKKNKGTGVAPSKICPECDEIVGASAKVCPQCGYEFPKAPPVYKLSDADINDRSPITSEITGWKWSLCKARNGNDLLMVRYYGGGLIQPAASEVFSLWCGGRGEAWAYLRLRQITDRLSVVIDGTAEELVEKLNASQCPVRVKYVPKGKYLEIVERCWQ